MILALLGCAGAPLPSPGPRAATFDVAVAVASGDRSLTALYELRTERRAPDVWAIWTARSEGVLEEAGGGSRFDSSAPTVADPWALTLQHLVASVPAEIRLDRAGRPAELLRAEEWLGAARAAVYGSTLPHEALVAVEGLLDPAGLLDDLARSFPGAPPDAGPWIRPERLAGIDARREEPCDRTHGGGVTTWDCRGAAAGPTTGPARLHEVRSWTRLEVDRSGLRSLDAGYEGTVLMVGPDGRTVFDRPIAGRRRVERR